MAYPHEVDDAGVVIRKNVNANQGAGEPREKTSVTGRPSDQAPDNTTFADRKSMQGRGAENKGVSSAASKAELLDEAARRGIAVDDSMTKTELLDALRGG